MRSGVKEILRIVSTFPDDCFYNVSDESWMETSHFQEWFDRVFVENTKSTDGPKLLIFDGHVSHITLEIVNSAKKNNVHIICLPSHTTNVLQPLDVAVFKPVKTEWCMHS